MLRAARHRPGRVSKHARRPMQRVLAQPRCATRHSFRGRHCGLSPASAGLQPPTRARRRTARNRARTRRAMRAPSAGAISPRATAVRTATSTCRISSTVRNDDRSIPKCFAGSVEGSGGGNSCPGERPRQMRPAVDQIRQHPCAQRTGRKIAYAPLRVGNAARVAGASLGKAPARVARAKQKEIRINRLRLLDSGSRPQFAPTSRALGGPSHRGSGPPPATHLGSTARSHDTATQSRQSSIAYSLSQKSGGRLRCRNF